MFQSRIAPATPFVEQARPGAGRRMLGLGLALAIEALMLLLLFTMGPGRPPGVEEDSATVVTFIAPEAPEKAEEEPSPEAEPQPAERSETRPRPPEQPQPLSPVPPAAEPPPQPILPMQWQLPPSTAIRPSPSRPAPPPSAAYGPADNRPAASRDSEQVGTAPNGEPLYAAEWYREPGEQMLRNYLSTAHGPGWGLIACRTAPDYRVEDCVALEEWPQGSQINRAVLAAAWEFRVRPPRRGGRSLVGAWVRIRIDYELRRR